MRFVTGTAWDAVLGLAVVAFGFWLAARQSGWIARVAVGLFAIVAAFWVGGVIVVGIEEAPLE